MFTGWKTVKATFLKLIHSMSALDEGKIRFNLQHPNPLVAFPCFLVFKWGLVSPMMCIICSKAGKTAGSHENPDHEIASFFQFFLCFPVVAASSLRNDTAVLMTFPSACPGRSPFLSVSSFGCHVSCRP